MPTSTKEGTYQPTGYIECLGTSFCEGPLFHKWTGLLMSEQSEILQCLKDRKPYGTMSFEETADRAKQLSEEIRDPLLMAYGCYAKGLCLYGEGLNITEIYNNIYEGLDAARKDRDNFAFVDLYILSGMMADLHGWYSFAMDQFMNGLEYAENLPAYEREWKYATILANIGQCYKEAGDPDRAVTYLKKAYENLQGHERHPFYERNLASLYLQMGDTAVDISDYGLAEESLQKCSALIDHVKTDQETIRMEAECLRFNMRLGMMEADEADMQRLLAAIDAYGLNADNITEAVRVLERLCAAGIRDLASELIGYFRSHKDDLPASVLQTIIRLEIMLRGAKDPKNMELALAYFNYSEEMETRNLSTELDGMKIRERSDVLRRENTRLQKEAETDALTGIANRYRLSRVSDELFEKSYRDQTSMAYEILDIDDFKSYNDTMGHAVGDQCLKAVGKALSDLQDQYPDLFCARYGGDEFVLLYQNMKEEEILHIAEDLRTRIQKDVKQVLGKHTEVTVSQGIRDGIPSGKNKLWDYMTAADHQLYDIKRAAKGRIKYVNGMHTDSIQDPIIR
jgi:diguanylate cyclase (GGDEF)-like protein